MSAKRFAAALAACLLSVTAAAAQTPPAPAPVYTPTSLAVARDVPRGRDGRPILEGEVWETPFFAGLTGIPLLTPAQLNISEEQAATSYAALMRTISANPLIALDPEAGQLLADGRGYPIVRGQRRSRLLVLPADGRVPMTPAANTELARIGALINSGLGVGRADNPEDRMLSERCLSQGAIAPMVNMSTLHPRQFTVTHDHVVIQVEYGDEVRIIPFTDTHGRAAPGQPFGDAIARWEGDTLVIETINSPANQRLRPSPFGGGGLIVNADAKVIERYTRVSVDEMIYQFTIEDPKVYSAPWLAEYSMFRADFRMFPSSCHEHNYGLENILSGARET